ncbi:UDP-3-O-acyl-N-acetylglucosamine deacetylase [Enterovirga rhinocerotis]|uniref:UDP-3-O-acyl-N-acetylglucosamine deacetylase n=1 Tax=Enterovirga rhinocerotis TaxID=1339210 RepID=A0A4R7BUG6_9HYPH|nr:UDP-3-O-acyl-N-acetylglucosamine deacetylase [Enterovirga rhinocerotis]TDR89033.1 UDP-3-O-[3-hydroxymyristoyl] N-acetylglucosamine deacetylase [Enterovirga rhinocerotis]
MKSSHQATLGAPVSLRGIGVHSGKPVNLHLHPAQAGHGIVFLRTGLPHGRDRLIEANFSSVTATELCTVIGDKETGAVATIEHLMAAFSALGVDNVLVEIDGAEVPILDGSASPFVEAIDSVGLVRSAATRRYLKVLKPVRVEKGIASAELLPNSRGFRLDVAIDFQNPIIGKQRKVMDLTPDRFRHEISRARTFGFIGDVEKLWKAGFALGASLENTVAIGDGAIINPEGLRFADEFVRHKMLDAVGDLSLTGFPLLATYKSHCSGHRLNVAVLEALLSDRANYAIVDGGARRQSGYAEIGTGMAVPAYAPDLH